MRRAPPPPWPALVATVIACLLLADIALFGLLPVYLLYPGLPADEAQPVEVAAVLFNGFTPTRTGINNETKRRLQHGLLLLRRNRARFLLVAGGNRPDKAENGARLMAAYLRDHGVEETKILIEDQSRDSFSNLVRIKEKLKEQGLGSVGLVSSPHHLLRIKALNCPAAAGFRFLPYNASTCDPPLGRVDIWLSAHFNIGAWLASLLLPSPVYDSIVLWARTHTNL